MFVFVGNLLILMLMATLSYCDVTQVCYDRISNVSSAITALVLARGGSKGIKLKNIQKIDVSLKFSTPVLLLHIYRIRKIIKENSRNKRLTELREIKIIFLYFVGHIPFGNFAYGTTAGQAL